MAGIDIKETGPKEKQEGVFQTGCRVGHETVAGNHQPEHAGGRCRRRAEPKQQNPGGKAGKTEAEEEPAYIRIVREQKNEGLHQREKRTRRSGCTIAHVVDEAFSFGEMLGHDVSMVGVIAVPAVNDHGNEKDDKGEPSDDAIIVAS